MDSTESNNTFANIDKLRITQDFGDISVETAYTHIPLRKPGKTEFFRVNPSEESRGQFLFLDYSEPGSMTKDKYLIVPELVNQIPDVSGVKAHLVVTAVSRPENAPFLWPIRLPNKTMFGLDTWALSDLDILKRSEGQWLRRETKPGMQGYVAVISKAEWPEPEFPDLSFQEMLTKAIPDERIIKDQSHTVIRKIRGEI